MKKEEKFIEMQKVHMNDDANIEERKNVHQSWFDSESIDYWRHKRMYSTIALVAEFYNKGKWLTVGDGRYGLDSYRLNKQFNLDVFPTDISENMLREGKEMGIVKEYSVENAESLSFKDNSFEVVFCKEAFHHLPRPLIGLYEMIRVASEAVILIEPHDEPAIPHRVSKKKYVISAMKMLMDKLSGTKSKPYLPTNDYKYYNIHGNFETSGNYVYGISNREINKVVHSLNLGGMAFYQFNDVYEPGVEFEKADSQSKLFESVKNKIIEIDSTNHYYMSATVIFIHKINEKLKQDMEKAGFIFPNKTENQYIS
jgi:ubiquinone/menaquinone biosynthesis C-methylase UbiE